MVAERRTGTSVLTFMLLHGNCASGLAQVFSMQKLEYFNLEMCPAAILVRLGVVSLLCGESSP